MYMTFNSNYTNYDVYAKRQRNNHIMNSKVDQVLLHGDSLMVLQSVALQYNGVMFESRLS